jgi:DnaJ-class molecular chaperone
MKQDTNYALQSYALCNGRGKYLLGKTCAACGGQGSVLVYPPPQKCALCRGLGTTNLFTREPCSACEGTGWAHTVVKGVPR